MAELEAKAQKIDKKKELKQKEREEKGSGFGGSVGRWHRSVNEVAVELGCDWHTINNTVLAYGTPLSVPKIHPSALARL